MAQYQNFFEHQSKLTIEIRNIKPVPLADLTKAFSDTENQFNHFLDREGIELRKSDSQLYVREIRTGSIIAELTPYIVVGLPLLHEFNTVVKFGTYLHMTYNWLLGKIQRPDIHYQRRDLEQLSGIINPTANDNGSSIVFLATDGATQNVNLTLNSQEANAIQNKTEKEIANIQEPESKYVSKALLRWYQAKFDRDSRTGDRAIIESVSSDPLKTIFGEQAVKEQITRHDEKYSKPWQELAYLVDVEVQTIDGQPKLYKILHAYPEDTFDPDE